MTDPGEAPPPPVLRWALLEGRGVDAVVTTRDGGVSEGPYESLNLGFHVGDDPAAVAENRRRAAAAIGLGLDDLVVGAQTHGATAAVVGAGDRGRGARREDDAIAGVDALVTTDRTVGLVTMVADCVPLVLVDPVAGVLATVHAGWRGTVAGITARTLDAMGDLGADRSRVLAGVGPSIAGTRYQVGEEVAEAVRDRLGEAGTGADAAAVRPDGTGRWTVDLAAANVHLLEAAGVAPDRVEVMAIDTAAPALFSDRAVRPCGRFAVLARLV